MLLRTETANQDITGREVVDLLSNVQLMGQFAGNRAKIVVCSRTKFRILARKAIGTTTGTIRRSTSGFVSAHASQALYA